MWKIKRTCLSCRSFRLKDELSGVCKLDKSKKDNYPIKLKEDVCDSWSDCGQQYYIRTGWIKSREKLNAEGLEN